uniref:TetR/AcrR family transcriptional regulator n=1 Tax=Neorhizobium sp. EC2-8 TaxID=3129230 RepID=UPI003101297D
MRDIARRADVGLATLLRHFPTRETLFEALLCTNLDVLTQKAAELETSNAPDEALLSWFREWIAFAQSYRGCRHDGRGPREPGLCSLCFMCSGALRERATTAPRSG